MQRIAKKSVRKLPVDFASLVRLYAPRAIHDEVDYATMQEVIDQLTCIPAMSKGQVTYLQTLVILFSAYEAEAHAIDTSDLSALDMLRHLMEQHQMSASDLGRLLGERSLGPKILNGRPRAEQDAHPQAFRSFWGFR